MRHIKSSAEKTCEVVVLLAAYRGEAFIGEQVKSILDAPHPTRLIIRDESPDEKTSKELMALPELYTGRLNYVTARDATVKGHLQNFKALCHFAHQNESADYYCFSDQDDVWHANKLPVLSERIRETEGIGKTPTLVHCDLCVVDERMREIAPSYIHFQGFPDPHKHSFPLFLHQNVVTGCATLFNRSLLDIAHPIPISAVIHDHWFALCAIYFGQLEYVDQPLVNYRQHGENAIGATSVENQRSFFKPYLYRMILSFPKHLSQAVEQAKALEKRRIERGLTVSECNQQWVAHFASLKELSFWRRLMSFNQFFPGKRGIKERAYLLFVLMILPYVQARKEED